MIKKKLLFTISLFISVLFVHSNNDKYRLIITDDPSSTITIGWNQISGSNPIVYYDIVDHGVDHTLYAFSQTVDRSVSYQTMNNNFVRLSGLTPNTNYYFIIRDSEGTSQRFWFRTAPNDNSRLSFVAGGDSRNNRIARRDANELVAKLKPHAVLFGGDLTDNNNNQELRDWLDDWQYTVASDGRMFPIIPARGNHETDPNTIYNLFDVPDPNSYYAVTFGNDLMRFYSLNTEISVLGDQLTWLNNDLTSSSDVTWKMAQYHKPMRPHTHLKENLNNIYFAWAQLFYDKGVRLVIDCDSHMSKTTWPVKPSSESGNDEGFVIEPENGTVYAGEGGWGAPLRPANNPKSWTRNSGVFNQFKLIFVSPTEIELRTILVDNADDVGEVSNTDPFTLPPLLNVFNPPTGDVVTITNDYDSICPEEFSPCDDGDPNTIYDEEDGDCNCSGFDSYNISEYTTTVQTGSDDAEELISSGTVSVNSSDLELIRDSFDQVIGIRFAEVEIPKQSTIIRAYIQFTVDESINPLDPEDSQEDTDLLIHGELSPNSNTFSTATNNISSRPLTNNSKSWVNIEDWGIVGTSGFNQRSPDLSNIVTEIMSQPTWVDGNPVTFIISGSGQRVANAVEENGDPKLIILYDSNCPIKLIELGAQGTCDESNDKFSQDIILTYENEPNSGVLNVNGQFFPITSSPQTITLTNLDANGLDVDIEAYFTAEPDCLAREIGFFESPSNCSNGGIPDNFPDDNSNLALLPEAVLTGSVSTNGRGNPLDILYDPILNDYRVSTNYNEYGEDFNKSIGTPGPDGGFKWQVNWPNVKYVNYITFGGTYPNQPQPNTIWRISYRLDGVWNILEEGQGGWIDSGIYEWGGSTQNPIEADAFRVQLYSDGFTEVISIHLRGRGGSSLSAADDSATTPKATLIQYLAPGNDCGVSIPSNTILYCSGDWINGNEPNDSSGSTNIYIANGTYTVPAGVDIEVNDLEVASGASVVVGEGGSLTVNGDLTNNGSLLLQSTSTSFASLIVEGTSTGDVSFARHVNSYNGTTGNDLVSPPFSGQDFGGFAGDNPNLFANPGNTDQKLFGPFNETSGSYQTYFASADATVALNSGTGYRAARNAAMDGTYGTTLTFTGTVETAGFSVPITESTSSFSGWNLIGNPYPSYIDFQTFFDLNKSQLDGGGYQAVYGYDGDASNGWTILNSLSTGVLIAPGQGFFVKAKAGGGTISFAPGMRTKGNTDDFIAGRNSLGMVKLQIDNGSATFETDIYFDSNASLGLDPGYDASLFGGTAPEFSVYTHLVQQNTGTPMAIQALGENDLDDVVVPLGIHALQGNVITVGISQMTIPATVEVYLEDTQDNSFTLLNNGDYSFTADTDIVQAGRFFLRFGASVLATAGNTMEGLAIYARDRSIIVEGSLQYKAELTLYDIQGRVVASQALDTASSYQSLDASTLAKGVYIVQLVDSQNARRTRKLVIE